MRGTLNDQDSVIDWLEFFDPENELRKFRINLTFALSGYHCIFGQGCPGLLNRGVQPSVGCCERGVTFVNEDDFANVTARVGELTAEDCENLDHVLNKGWFQSTKDGKPYKTRKLKDRCIFSNSEEFWKMGCAFHHLAERTGQRMIDTKPDICWQVPICYDESREGERDDIEVLTITPFDADSWGGTDDEEEPSGHGYMGFWCIDTPDAYNNTQPVYQSHEEEWRKMMGDAGYDELVRIIKKRRLHQHNRPSKMPGEVRNDGRPLLPLLIEQRKDVTPAVGKWG